MASPQAIQRTSAEPEPRGAESGSRRRLAVLLRSEGELGRALASFYALGVKRGGWLAHRSLVGRGDRDRDLLAGAGLDVPALEAEGRMVIAEIDPSVPPERFRRVWSSAFDAALSEGFAGVWYARFAVGVDGYEAVLPHDRVWESCFNGHPVVALCPYVVGEVAA